VVELQFGRVDADLWAGGFRGSREASQHALTRCRRGPNRKSA